MNTILKTTKHYVVLIVIFFIVSLCNVNAQECSSKNKPKKEFFTFGPKLSVNFIQESFAYPKEFVPGADLGFFFRITPARLYIQPEIHYQIRNTNIDMGGWPMRIVQFRTHHISIPLLIGVKAVDLKLFKLRFFAGPEFSFRLKENGIETVFQLGFQTGLGFDIWRFTIDAGYSLLGYMDSNTNTYSNIFKIGLGFKCF